MDYIGIAAIILAVVMSVHYVHKFAYNSGVKSGVEKGRLEILKENLMRIKDNDNVLDEINNHIKQENGG